ncbi:GlcG/HbpS family heme-binding protein [Denitrificimonas caeni]|uniref:GlcG/HbpS family heme-binding protein n=1 Tax=Denitrificimonas caeni TaxID=521720 RepID=UPI001964FA52|nr:heme-binding protein [Denitrificimonas caeni]
MKLSIPQSTISWQAAHCAVEAAIQEALQLGVRINVAVTDGSGNLMAFLRMPGAFPQSINIAIDKAHTAAGFGFATGDWMKVCGDNEAMKLGFAAQPGLIIFAGGLPIRSAGELIGGIGVSGASEEQDTICAQAGLAAIGADQS